MYPPSIRINEYNNKTQTKSSMSDTIFSQYKGGDSGTPDCKEYQVIRAGGKPVMPGTNQYKVTDEQLSHFDQPEDLEKDSKEWTSVEAIPPDYLEKLTPQTDVGLANKWEVVTVFEKRDRTGVLCALKAAMRNVQKPKEFALITAISPNEAKHYVSRLMKKPSSSDGWRICSCRMIAPYIFWNKLKRVLEERNALMEDLRQH
jgi:hypothetical protein